MPKAVNALEHYEAIPEAGCWIWMGALHKNGYGRYWERPSTKGTSRKPKLAHRLFYAFHRGDIPAGMEVCHRCDNRICVNPEHLFLATHTENMLDMRNKRRQAKNQRHGMAKLTDNQVRAIRKLLLTLSQHQIAKEYGVSQTAIRDISTGKRWRHLE